jgi:hypothetical protein
VDARVLIVEDQEIQRASLLGAPQVARSSLYEAGFAGLILKPLHRTRQAPEVGSITRLPASENPAIA